MMEPTNATVPLTIAGAKRGECKNHFLGNVGPYESRSMCCFGLKDVFVWMLMKDGLLSKILGGNESTGRSYLQVHIYAHFSD